MLEVPMVARIGAQGLVEYGLIIALVAILAITGLLLFGPQVNSLLSQVSGSV
jgi:Flp pilus assembly pilin Flp